MSCADAEVTQRVVRLNSIVKIKFLLVDFGDLLLLARRHAEASLLQIKTDSLCQALHRARS